MVPPFTWNTRRSNFRRGDAAEANNIRFLFPFRFPGSLTLKSFRRKTRGEERGIRSSDARSNRENGRSNRVFPLPSQKKKETTIGGKMREKKKRREKKDISRRKERRKELSEPRRSKRGRIEREEKIPRRDPKETPIRSLDPETHTLSGTRTRVHNLHRPS